MGRLSIKKQYVLLAIRLTLVTSLVFLSVPLVNHSIRSYFACDVRCSAFKVIANPWLYHSRKVTLTAFLRLKFEGNVLYPLEEYYKYTLSPSEGIWIDVDTNIKSRRNELNSEYVEITGTFNALQHGHGDLFIGVLENIEKVQVRSPLSTD